MLDESVHLVVRDCVNSDTKQEASAKRFSRAKRTRERQCLNSTSAHEVQVAMGSSTREIESNPIGKVRFTEFDRY